MIRKTRWGRTGLQTRPDGSGDPSYKLASGFTLVELMVAMTLLLVLSGIALMILPRISDGQYTTQAATQLQQAIEVAKQSAAKDRVPRGVRLLPGPANPTQITTLEYLEQPDDAYNNLGGVTVSGVLAPSIATVDPAVGLNIVTFTNGNRTLTGGFGGASNLYPIQTGDYIQLGGVVFKINSVIDDIHLSLTTPATPIVTSSYRFIRQPRPIGSDPIEMPKNIIVDLTPRGIGGGQWDLPRPLPTAPVDIMFAPDGRVIGSLAGRDKIILWVRDSTLPDGEGDPTLVVIYPRTGLIAAYPVDIANILISPYTYTSAGKRLAD